MSSFKCDHCGICHPKMQEGDKCLMCGKGTFHYVEKTPMDRCLDHIGDAFRDERKRADLFLLNMCRNQELIEAGHYTAEQLGIGNKEKREALRLLWWMEEDNKRMNERHETSLHRWPPHYVKLYHWLSGHNKGE